MTFRFARNVLCAAAALAGTAAMAQPAWAPPPDWGPGWSRWEGHNYGRRWAGPAYYYGPGEHQVSLASYLLPELRLALDAPPHPRMALLLTTGFGRAPLGRTPRTAYDKIA